MTPTATGRQTHGRGAAVVLAAGLLAALFGLHPAAAGDEGCPASDEILSRLEKLGLERATRTVHFSTPPPFELYRKASRNVGHLELERDGTKGMGVAVLEKPVEVLWRAINDEDAQDEGGYTALNRSEVIGGTPRGVDRRVFQAGERMGLGRWWVTRTFMNGDLFTESAGALWEVVWTDEMDGLEDPPVEDPPDLSPIEWTRGAWLLVPLGDECTMVEHFTWSEAGGFVGFMQKLVFGKALRQSIEGILALAEGEYHTAPEGPPFVKPDGSPLEPSAGTEGPPDSE